MTAIKKLLNDPLYIIYTLSIIFILAIAFDLSPFLRGPIDSILPSRWPYYFVNTLNKVWAPLLTGGLIIAFHLLLSTKIRLNRASELLFLFVMVILVFLFSLSLVYFSRFGINVLFRRITDSGINGYFSSAVKIKNVEYFIKNFNDSLKNLDQHGRDHPPGSILMLKGIIFFFEKNPSITKTIINAIKTPNDEKTKLLWTSLTQAQRAAAIFSAFFLHFIAALSIIPVYLLSKLILKQENAIKAIFLYALTPSLSFFPLLFDPFYVVFPCLNALFIYKGFKKKKNIYIYFAGFFSALGLFFSISIIPSLTIPLIIFIYCIKSINFKRTVNLISTYLFGFLSLAVIFYLVGYNIIKSSMLVTIYQAPREYIPWLFFNPYDFFLYMGIPTSLLFIFITISWNKLCIHKKIIEAKILKSFWIVFVALVISGLSRGEVGRIWLSLMIIPILLISYFLAEVINIHKFKFSILLSILILQILVMEEFWVPIW